MSDPEATIVGSAPPALSAPPPDLPPAPPAHDDDAPASRLVPLPVLLEERQRAGAFKDQATAAETRAAELTTRIGDLERQLSSRPAPVVPPPGPAVPEMDDAQAELFARTLELYDATTGQLDLAKARKVGGMVTQLATKEAQKAVAPIASASAKDLSERLKSRAAAVKDPSGRGVDAKALDFMWQAVPPEIAADPAVAAVLTYAAAGYERFHGRPETTAPPPAVVSERVGGHPPDVQSLSEVEAAFLEKTGRDPKKYMQSLKGYKPGLNNILE